MDPSMMDAEYSGCAEHEPFALQVLGDSMSPEFEHGCIVIIDPGGVVENGCFVMAELEDGYILRQLLIQEGRFYLKPMMSSYETVEIPGIHAIKGVVTQRAGRRRRDRKHYHRLPTREEVARLQAEMGRGKKR